MYVTSLGAGLIRFQLSRKIELMYVTSLVEKQFNSKEGVAAVHNSGQHKLLSEPYSSMPPFQVKFSELDDSVSSQVF